MASIAWQIRARVTLTCGSSLGPSSPQLADQFASVPSRLPSPLASLCLFSYRDDIGQCETVMAGGKIDGGPGSAVLHS